MTYSSYNYIVLNIRSLANMGGGKILCFISSLLSNGHSNDSGNSLPFILFVTNRKNNHSSSVFFRLYRS